MPGYELLNIIKCVVRVGGVKFLQKKKKDREMEVSLPLKKKSHKNNKTNNCKKCFLIYGTKI
jgi:hypothetical protein